MRVSVVRMKEFLHSTDILGTNWGPTDRVLFKQSQLVKKQLLMKPPHAFGSHLAKKSDTEEV